MRKNYSGEPLKRIPEPILPLITHIVDEFRAYKRGLLEDAQKEIEKKIAEEMEAHYASVDLTAIFDALSAS